MNRLQELRQKIMSLKNEAEFRAFIEALDPQDAALAAQAVVSLLFSTPITAEVSQDPPDENADLSGLWDKIRAT